jgi:hypothetical protein
MAPKTKARGFSPGSFDPSAGFNSSADIRYERQDRQRGDLKVLVQQQHAHGRPTSDIDLSVSYILPG